MNHPSRISKSKQRKLATQFYERLVAHDIAHCKRLIRKGAPMDLECGVYPDALHFALRYTLYDLADFMVEHGAPLDTRGVQGETPLHIACMHKQAALGLKMVERGARLDIADAEGNMPLHYAAAFDTGLSMAMVERKAPLVAYNNDHETPLHIAYAHSHDALVEAMVHHGASPHLRNKLGRTVLDMAVSQKNESLATFFVDAAPHLDDRALVLQSACRKDMERLSQRILAGKERISAFTLGMAHGAQLTSTGLHDMYRQWFDHVTLPVLLGGDACLANPRLRALFDQDGSMPLPRFIKRNEGVVADFDNIALFTPGLHAMFPAPTVTQDDLARPGSAAAHAFFRPMRLSAAWHHPAVTLPRSLLPLQSDYSWRPLLQDDFVASNGLRITCLTSSAALDEESRLLNHCVGKGDYDQKCRWGDIHILSVCSSDGTPLSTLEIELMEGRKGIPIPGKKEQIVVQQHHGMHDGPPPADAVQAWGEFEQAVREGRCRLARAPYGETEASITQRKGRALLAERIGYLPTHSAINAVFDEFLRPYRCAITGRNERGRMIHDVLESEDGYTHRNDFIAGYAAVSAEGMPTGRRALFAADLPLNPGERVVDLRTLDAESYLRATGELAPYREMIRKETPEFAALLEPIWKAQDAQPLRQRVPGHVVRTAQLKQAGMLAAQAAREYDTYFSGC